jgi:outer membrane protein assembly factor BamB
VKSLIRISTVMAATFALSACGMFGGKDDDEQKPMELTDIETTMSVKRLWNVKVGGEAEFLRIALRPVGDGTRIYAASRNGNVVALQPASGKEIWRRKLDTELSAGPGAGENLVVVGSSDGVLIALDATTGEEKWRANVSGESLARPLIRGEVVIAPTIDNRLHAVSAFDGSSRWTVDQPTPRLTMRGSASPVAVGATVVAGFDNGKLLAINADTGDIVWEQNLSPPTGRSDLERLADVDGLISVVGQDVYAAGYQGSLASLASESGQVLWSREISTFEGVSADWNNLYTVTEKGEIVALTRLNGDEAWRQASLLRREPTLPIAFHTSVVVGDLEGYLHFFSNFDGDPVARLRMGGAAITAEPVVVADRLYVQNDAGELAAYGVREPERRRRAPDTADEGS